MTDLERMVTLPRAERVARKLFADEIADGSDCKAEHGFVGLPCTVCAANNERWAARIQEVRAAMMEAFK